MYCYWLCYRFHGIAANSIRSLSFIHPTRFNVSRNSVHFPHPRLLLRYPYVLLRLPFRWRTHFWPGLQQLQAAAHSIASICQPSTVAERRHAYRSLSCTSIGHCHVIVPRTFLEATPTVLWPVGSRDRPDRYLADCVCMRFVRLSVCPANPLAVVSSFCLPSFMLN